MRLKTAKKYALDQHLDSIVYIDYLGQNKYWNYKNLAKALDMSLKNTKSSVKYDLDLIYADMALRAIKEPEYTEEYNSELKRIEKSTRAQLHSSDCCDLNNIKPDQWLVNLTEYTDSQFGNSNQSIIFETYHKYNTALDQITKQFNNCNIKKQIKISNYTFVGHVNENYGKWLIATISPQKKIR